MAASMTTAMTQAVDTPASATTALPALSSTESGAMTVPMWSIVVLVVGLAVTAGWALYARAVRVDRLHRQVLGARATLEAQLVHRAEAAAELATVPALDPASGLLLSRAAREALDAEGPLVDDGLDTSTPLEGTPSSHPASSGAALPAPTARSRALIESDLSRVLRTVRRPAEPARAQPPGPGLLPPGPGPQVPQHPRQRGPGPQGTAARPDVPPGWARTHAPDLRCRRRHHP